MRLRTLALSLIGVGLVVTSIIVWQVGWSHILEILSRTDPKYLGAFILVSLSIAVMLTWKWRLILHAQGIHIPFQRLLAYRFASYSVSYLTASIHVGSEPVRAFLLQRDGVPAPKAVSNVIIDKSIELAANAIFFFIGALLILNSSVGGSTKVILLAMSMLFMILVGLFIAGLLHKRSMFAWLFRVLQLHRIPALQDAERSLAEVEWQVAWFYRERKQYFFGMVVIMSALWGLMFLEYKTALLTLGINASPAQIFLILTGVGLAYSIPVPIAMGVLELGQLAAMKVLRISAAAGISLAFLIRARDLLWTVFGIIALFWYDVSFRKLAKRARQIDRDFQEGRLARRMR